jgi:segregation and condensation protein B
MSEPQPETVTTTAKHILEAMLFASDEPLSAKQLLEVLNQSYASVETTAFTLEQILEFVAQLNQEYDAQQRAFHIIAIAEGFQFATRPQFAHWLGELFKEKIKRRLSPSALETLAIVAYKQPVSKPEIESIRGVNADYVMSSLLERNLITIVGRASTIGRPLLYGTTEQFLHHFGLKNLKDLPRLREIEDLMKESETEVEKRILSDAMQTEEALTN